MCWGMLSLLFAALVVGGAMAEEPATAATKQALAEYLAKIEEIDRVAAKRKEEAKQRLTKMLEEGEKFEAELGARYRGMLGSYFDREGRIPFVLLSVPSGDNVLGEYARSVLHGRYDFSQPLTRFHARGHVAVPKAGRYLLEASRGYGDFKLNGLGYGLVDAAPGNRYRTTATLAAGVYEVEFSTINNGGQLPEASIRIVDEQSQDELPIFVYESELKAFESDLSQGVELIELSKWTREENRLK